MMTAKVVDTYANVDDHHQILPINAFGLQSNGTATASPLLLINSSALADSVSSTTISPFQLLNSTLNADPITKIEVATSLALTVGIVNVSCRLKRFA